jgi:hypothetical protein
MYSSVIVHPAIHLKPKPRPPASAGAETPPQAVDSSAMMPPGLRCGGGFDRIAVAGQERQISKEALCEWVTRQPHAEGRPRIR